MQEELTCRHFIKTTAHGIYQSNIMEKEYQEDQRTKTIKFRYHLNRILKK